MKIAVVTGSVDGIARLAVPALHEAGVEITLVLFCHGRVPNKKKYYLRKIKKIRQIGVGGMFIGFMLRRWFGKNMQRYLPGTEALQQYCICNNIPFAETMQLNSTSTVEMLRKAGADAGLSLSNSYIAPRVFSVFPKGMVNVHGEILPEYQNAQSVIWQLHNGSRYTGYTIHKVENRIDAGAIVFQERFPITFKSTLATTVAFNCARITERAVYGVVRCFTHFDQLNQNATLQPPGNHYTTPSFREFLKMRQQFKRLSRSDD